MNVALKNTTSLCKFPGPTDRLYILGKSGSGKTTAALWHLSGKDFKRQPWLIVNTKGDSTLNELAEIPGVRTIEITGDISDEGLFHVRPSTTTEDDQQALDDLLGRVWEHGNCGVLIDEGYMIERDRNLNGLLTQGRDKHIPMIVLTQRPTWISKFVESEANFVQLFQLSRLIDRKNITGLVPVDKNYRLEKFNSYWYNTDDDVLLRWSPVPNKSVILDTFRAMFPPEHDQITPEGEPLRQPSKGKRVV